MANKRYETGENVPTDICSVSVAEGMLTFVVSVEVYYGYGSAKYTCPTEQIECISDLFATDGEPAEMAIVDEIRLYTVPHDALCWVRRHTRGLHMTRTTRKLMVDYQTTCTTTYQGDD